MSDCDLLVKEPPVFEPYYLKDELGNLDLTSWDGKTRFLDKNWSCYYMSDAVEFKLLIRKGFVTDLGSVPWPFTIAVDDAGIFTIPYLIHDWGYATWLLPKSEIDNILYNTYRFVGGNWVTSNGVYYSVKWGARGAWNGHAKDKKGNWDYNIILNNRKICNFEILKIDDSLNQKKKEIDKMLIDKI